MTLPNAGRPLLRNIRLAYILALTVILLVIIGKHTIALYYLSAQEGSASIINVAGRQRMLSQRIIKQLLILEHETDGKLRKEKYDSLLSCQAEWKMAHQALTLGSEQLYISDEAKSPELKKLYEAIEPHYLAIQAEVSQVLKLPLADINKTTIKPYVDKILVEEPQYLRLMNSITHQYAYEAKDKLLNMEVLEWVLLAMAMLVLLFEAWFIFIPLEKSSIKFIYAEDRARADLLSINAKLTSTLDELQAARAVSEKNADLLNEQLLELQISKRKLANSERQLHKVQSLSKTAGYDIHYPSFKVVFSAAAKEMFGMQAESEENYLNRVIGDANYISKQVWLAIQRQEEYNLHFQIMLPDGTSKYIQSMGAPFYNENVELEFYEGSFKDVTIEQQANLELAHLNGQLAQKVIEQQQNQDKLISRELELSTALQKSLLLTEELERKTQMLAMAQELALLGSYRIVTNEKKIYWEPETALLLGLPADTDPNSAILSNVMLVSKKEMDDTARDCILNKRPFSTEYSIRRADNGNLRFMRNIGRPVIREDGWVTSIIGTLQDITQEVNTRRELEAARQEAENAAEAKTMFLSTMSHEIRTPMNAVIGFSQLLMLENNQPELIENLRTLQYSANHLLSLLNDILDFSRIESGKLEFEEAEFNVAELCDNVVRMFALQAIEKHIRLELIQPVFIQINLLGDTVRLNQILTNLVGNALKFTHGGNVSLSYTIEQDTDTHLYIRFTVKDTGIGIPENKIDDIFETFTQANKETTRKYGGTGLGLAISKRLVDLQDGKIWVKSVEGRGSEFSFIIPFKKGSPIKEIATKAIIKDEAKFSLHGAKILVVEDNPINQIVVRKFLTRWDAQVEMADNGEIGVEKVKTGYFDLVLMDLQMPVMDGYTATKTIRQMGAPFNTMPIVALTASASLEVKETVEKNGLTDYVLKPFVANDLYYIIKKHLR